MTAVDRAGAYQWMDAVRALAAGIVVFSHLRDLFLIDFAAGTSHQPVIAAFYFGSGFGHAGVIVFFVLSGFWITRSVVRRSGSSRFWTPYLIDRLSRLWIVLVPALLMGGALDLIGTHTPGAGVYEGGNGAHSVPPETSEAVGVWSLVANLLFLQTLLSPVFGSNGPLWSLAFEFWYYLWFPALWLMLRHRRWSFALPTLLVGSLNPEMYLGFVSWLCGAALYAAVEHGRCERLPRRARSAVLCSGIAVLATALLVVRIRPSLWFDPVLAAAFAWFLFGLCLAAPRPNRFLAPLARFGATSSFSLYAVHYPVIMVAAALLVPEQRWPPTAAALAMTGALFAGLVALGWLFSRVTEANTARVRRRAAERLTGAR